MLKSTNLENLEYMSDYILRGIIKEFTQEFENYILKLS
jgi:hypothetical protein